MIWRIFFLASAAIALDRKEHWTTRDILLGKAVKTKGSAIKFANSDPLFNAFQKSFQKKPFKSSNGDGFPSRQKRDLPFSSLNDTLERNKRCHNSEALQSKKEKLLGANEINHSKRVTRTTNPPSQYAAEKEQDSTPDITSLMSPYRRFQTLKEYLRFVHDLHKKASSTLQSKLRAPIQTSLLRDDFTRRVDNQDSLGFQSKQQNPADANAPLYEAQSSSQPTTPNLSNDQKTFQGNTLQNAPYPTTPDLSKSLTSTSQNFYPERPAPILSASINPSSPTSSYQNVGEGYNSYDLGTPKTNLHRASYQDQPPIPNPSNAGKESDPKVNSHLYAPQGTLPSQFIQPLQQLNLESRPQETSQFYNNPSQPTNTYTAPVDPIYNAEPYKHPEQTVSSFGDAPFSVNMKPPLTQEKVKPIDKEDEEAYGNNPKWHYSYGSAKPVQLFTVEYMPKEASSLPQQLPDNSKIVSPAPDLQPLNYPPTVTLNSNDTFFDSLQKIPEYPSYSPLSATQELPPKYDQYWQQIQQTNPNKEGSKDLPTIDPPKSFANPFSPSNYDTRDGPLLATGYSKQQPQVDAFHSRPPETPENSVTSKQIFEGGSWIPLNERNKPQEKEEIISERPLAYKANTIENPAVAPANAEMLQKSRPDYYDFQKYQIPFPEPNPYDDSAVPLLPPQSVTPEPEKSSLLKRPLENFEHSQPARLTSDTKNSGLPPKDRPEAEQREISNSMQSIHSQTNQQEQFDPKSATNEEVWPYVIDKNGNSNLQNNAIYYIDEKNQMRTENNNRGLESLPGLNKDNNRENINNEKPNAITLKETKNNPNEIGTPGFEMLHKTDLNVMPETKQVLKERPPNEEFSQHRNFHSRNHFNLDPREYMRQMKNENVSHYESNAPGQKTEDVAPDTEPNYGQNNKTQSRVPDATFVSEEYQTLAKSKDTDLANAQEQHAFQSLHNGPQENFKVYSNPILSKTQSQSNSNEEKMGRPENFKEFNGNGNRQDIRKTDDSLGQKQQSLRENKSKEKIQHPHLQLDSSEGEAGRRMDSHIFEKYTLGGDDTEFDKILREYHEAKSADKGKSLSANQISENDEKQSSEEVTKLQQKYLTNHPKEIPAHELRLFNAPMEKLHAGEKQRLENYDEMKKADSQTLSQLNGKFPFSVVIENSTKETTRSKANFPPVNSHEYKVLKELAQSSQSLLHKLEENDKAMNEILNHPKVYGPNLTKKITKSKDREPTIAGGFQAKKMKFGSKMREIPDLRQPYGTRVLEQKIKALEDDELAKSSPDTESSTDEDDDDDNDGPVDAEGTDNNNQSDENEPSKDQIPWNPWNLNFPFLNKKFPPLPHSEKNTTSNPSQKITSNLAMLSPIFYSPYHTDNSGYIIPFGFPGSSIPNPLDQTPLESLRQQNPKAITGSRKAKIHSGPGTEHIEFQQAMPVKKEQSNTKTYDSTVSQGQEQPVAAFSEGITRAPSDIEIVEKRSCTCGMGNENSIDESQHEITTPAQHSANEDALSPEALDDLKARIEASRKDRMNIHRNEDPKTQSLQCACSTKNTEDHNGNHVCSCNNAHDCRDAVVKAAQPTTPELTKYDILHNMLLWFKHFVPNAPGKT